MDKAITDDEFLELEHEEAVMREFAEDTMTDDEVEEEEVDEEEVEEEEVDEEEVEEEEVEEEEVEEEEVEEEEVEEEDYESPLLGNMDFLKMDFQCDHAMKSLMFVFAAELVILGAAILFI
jgi:hypothetical protein